MNNEYYIIFNFTISNNILINFKIILSICTMTIFTVLQYLQKYDITILGYIH